ncbi:MAG: diguanylate cyclase, partial [Lachnospiraceae bacterium]
MNILSIISIVIYTSFCIGAVQMLTAERKSVLNISASIVLLSLGWWSFCNSYFFASATSEQALFWHKLGSIGWCGFVAFTAYYFYALTNYNQKIMAWWKQILFFIPAVILIIRNLSGTTTSLAQRIIPSINGWGWTYENSIDSFWLWAYLIYVVVYFGIAFYLLYQWGKLVKHKMKREMAIRFIVLDVLTIFFGVVTDVILPLTWPSIPAMASIGTAFFGIGYFAVIYRQDVFNINLVISSDDILQVSNNSIFVIDENKEILKYNNAVTHLLDYNKWELIGTDFMKLIIGTLDFSQLDSNEDLINTEVKMQCKKGRIKDVLISASIAKDQRHNFLCVIISCQDVSKQKRTQAELEIEREKYHRLANDYQRLAYYDPLTNLPNRRQFFDVLMNFEQMYQKEKKDFAVFVLDLDNFKLINDTYGHAVGDELLKATAKKLQIC